MFHVKHRNRPLTGRLPGETAGRRRCAQQPLGGQHSAGWAYLLTTLVAAVCLAGYALLRLALLLATSVLAVTLTVAEAVADWTNGAAGGAAAVLTAGVVLLVTSALALRAHRHRVGSTTGRAG